MPVKETAKPERRGNAGGSFTKKVGGTTYRVNVHFSNTSRETLTEKMLRLIRREVNGL